MTRGATVAFAAGLVALLVAVVGAGAQGEPGEADLAAAVADLRTRVAGVEERLAERRLGTPVPGDGWRFEGEGDVVSEPFGLREGLLIARIEATGEGEVAATVFDRAGERLPFGTKELPYAGTLAERVPAAGDYVLAVESDGAWRVTLEQP